MRFEPGRHVAAGIGLRLTGNVTTFNTTSGRCPYVCDERLKLVLSTRLFMRYLNVMWKATSPGHRHVVPLSHSRIVAASFGSCLARLAPSTVSTSGQRRNLRGPKFLTPWHGMVICIRSVFMGLRGFGFRLHGAYFDRCQVLHTNLSYMSIMDARELNLPCFSIGCMRFVR